jgi:hypothetical protein
MLQYVRLMTADKALQSEGTRMSSSPSRILMKVISLLI